jgi:uncharacterized protein YbjT (DUF2867 family)
LKAAGVRRLIVVSSFGVGDSGRDAWILERVFFALGVWGAYADKDLQEQAVRESGLDYTIDYTIVLYRQLLAIIPRYRPINHKRNFASG